MDIDLKSEREKALETVEKYKMSGKLLARYNKLINFKGAIAAVAVPLNPDGTVNHEMFNAYTDHLISIGVGGVYINGTTGEGLSLSGAERMAVVQAWFQAIRTKKPDMLVIACISSTVVKETLEQANFYAIMNVDALAVLPPFYHRPETNDCLIRYLQSIYKAAPSLPLIYYHFPEMTNVKLDIRIFLEEAKLRVPNLAGIKYTCKDMAAISAVGYDLRHKYKIFTGYEECLLPMASMGIDAGICALFNFREAVTRWQAILNYFPSDLKAANEQQDGINDMKTIFAGGNFIHNVKKAISEETKGLVKLGKPRPPIHAHDQ
ncbi:N-acetylneuraminate lyase [Tetranychus urticae]|uniref:N-acetylneuraminate lyase n=1 Tax=Tetranychus urticae TaxID=32264 RepID=T1JQF8_TETUR|nr:N-acetylneuraminate lyase [Tetranychus urticae]